MTPPVARLLDRLERVRSNGSGWKARCPAHEDRTPSLSIGTGDDGRALLFCHAGCTFEEVVAAVGLAESDLFADDGRQRRYASRWSSSRPNDLSAADRLARLSRPDRPAPPPPDEDGDDRPDPSGLTLAAYAAHFRLPIDFLRSAGLDDTTFAGRPAVKIPYRDTSGAVTATRFRLALEVNRFRWARRPTLTLYGLPDLADALEAGRVVLVEGESDVHVLRHHGVPALGVPGAATWRDEWAEHFDGIETIYLVDERDDGAANLLPDLAASPIADRVRVVRMPDPHRDPADLHRADPEGFVEAFEDALAAAVPLVHDAVGDVRPVVSPSPGGSSLVRWRPFPTEALPSGVAHYVRAVAEAIGVDEAFVGLAVLVTLAGTIGNRARVELKSSWHEPSVLWGAIVARSGRMKSPVLAEVTRPIRRREADLIAKHRQRIDEHDRAVEAWADRPKAERGPKPEPPPAPPRSLVSDITVEALAERLADSPAGLLLYRDELAGWIRSFDRYRAGRGGDAQAWLEMHRAGSVLVDRKTSDGPLSVPRAAVSIIGSVQPEVLRDALSGEHFVDGLAARILFVMPPDRPKSWTDAELDTDLRDGWEHLLGRLRSPFDHESRPEDITLTRDARDVFIEFYNVHAIREANAPTDPLAAALSKIEGAAARLALVVQLAHDPDARIVGHEAMQTGIVLAEWFAHEVERVYGRFHETPVDRERRELVEWIEARGGHVTERDLQRGPRRYRESGAATDALEGLVNSGIGAWEERESGPRGGRPVRVFILGDGGDGDTTCSVAGGDKTPERRMTTGKTPATEPPSAEGVVSPSPGVDSQESAFERWAGRI